MKKFIIFFIVFISMVGCARLDSEVQDFGMSSAYEDTVARARDEREDTWVTLKGKIIEKIGDGLYVFGDPTGEIKVRIDDEAWGGVKFMTGMTVRLTGKVDREFSGEEIAVKKVEVVTQ